jgi:hypothetical protein
MIGMECTLAWSIITAVTVPFAICLPILFYRYLSNLKKDNLRRPQARLVIFYLLEYICLQGVLTPLFEDSETLCYGHGGQNGLGLVFAGWLSIPIIAILSLVIAPALKREGNTRG